MHFEGLGLMRNDSQSSVLQAALGCFDVHHAFSPARLFPQLWKVHWFMRTLLSFWACAWTYAAFFPQKGTAGM